MEKEETLVGRIPINNMRPGKFRNIKRGYYRINGKDIFLRSAWEANWSLYLNFLKMKGEIISWEYETKCFIFHKIQFGTRSYRPDFKVVEKDGTIIYHEIKGWMTPKSKTQLKRMAKYYPNIVIRLIDSNVYNKIKNQLGGIIKWF
jgi:hypothetical protein